MSVMDSPKIKKQRKSKKKSNKISFDDETVPKSVASKLNNSVCQENVTKSSSKINLEKLHDNCKQSSADKPFATNSEAGLHKRQKHKKNKVKSVIQNESKSENEPTEGATYPTTETVTDTESEQHKKKKRKKNKELILNSEVAQEREVNDQSTEECEQHTKRKLKKKKESSVTPSSEKVNELVDESFEDVTLNPTNPKIEKVDSIRAQKRKKHEQLLLAQKLKVDVAMQEKCLNYLSRWKHSQSDWKFEKLRQIWLLQNMFESDKVPDEFWETLVEYFGNSKGKIRQTMIDKALKIIENDKYSIKEVHNEEEEEKEKETKTEDQDNEVFDECKIQRAKSIIQALQE